MAATGGAIFEPGRIVAVEREGEAAEFIDGEIGDLDRYAFLRGMSGPNHAIAVRDRHVFAVRTDDQ